MQKPQKLSSLCLIIHLVAGVVIATQDQQPQLVTMKIRPPITRLESKETKEMFISASWSDPNMTTPLSGNLSIWSVKPFIASPIWANISQVTINDHPVLVTIRGKLPGRTKMYVEIKWNTLEGGNGTNDTQVALTTDMYQVDVTRRSSKIIWNEILMVVILLTSVTTVGVTGCTVVDWQWGALGEKFGWIFGGTTCAVIITPLLALGMVEIFNFVPGVKMGVLTAAVAPPALSALPVAVILEADIGVVAITVLLSLLLTMASLPIWVLRFRYWDPDLMLIPRDVPFVLIVFVVLMGTCAFALGVWYRQTQVVHGRTLRKVVLILSFANITFMLIAQLIFLGNLYSLLNQYVALCSLLVPAIVLVVSMLLIQVTDLDPACIKAMAICLLAKGSVVSVGLLNNVRRLDVYVDLAYASTTYYTLVTLIVALLTCVAYKVYQCMLQADQARQCEHQTLDGYDHVPTSSMTPSYADQPEVLEVDPVVNPSSKSTSKRYAADDATLLSANAWTML